MYFSGIAISHHRLRKAICFSLVIHAVLFTLWIRLKMNAPEPRSFLRIESLESSRMVELIYPGSSEASEPFSGQIQLLPASSEPVSAGHRPPSVTMPANRVEESKPTKQAKQAPSFFGMPIQAKRIVYVVDRSVSMGISQALDQAKSEILMSLSQLPQSARFQVVLYNLTPMPLQARSPDGLFAAKPAMIQEAKRQLSSILGTGGTDHVRALHWAQRYQPEVIFLVTDAEDLTTEEVEQITVHNRRWSKCVIHTIDLSGRERPSRMLQRLATENGGACRAVR